MPPFAPGVPRQVRTNYTVSFLDHRGKRRAARAPLSATATTLQRTALRDALGNGSNGALIETNSSTVDKVLNVSHPDNITFDEAYSTVDHVAVFMFQNNAGDIAAVELPAPDLQMFQADGETIDPANENAAAIIAAAIAAMNEGAANTMVYSTGYLSTRRNQRSRPRRLPGFIMEPGLGDEPDDEPGLPPA